MSVLDIKIRQTFDPTGEKGGYHCDRDADGKGLHTCEEKFVGNLGVYGGEPRPETGWTEVHTKATLAEAALLAAPNMKKFAEEILSVNRIFEDIPFDRIEGGKLSYSEPPEYYNDECMHEHWVKEAYQMMLGEFLDLVPMPVSMLYDLVQGAKKGKAWVSDSDRIINVKTGYYPLSLYRVEFGKITNITLNVTVASADASHFVPRQRGKVSQLLHHYSGEVDKDPNEV